jgi:hypothetical protein
MVLLNYHSNVQFYFLFHIILIIMKQKWCGPHNYKVS